MRRVQFDRLGGPEVLEVVEVDPPHPGPGEVRVHVRAAGLNPLDAKIFRGRPTANPHTIVFPSGNGGDFAGSVDELGQGVTSLDLGDDVLGGRQFHAQADFVVVSAERVVRTPERLDVIVAGALDGVGRTAWASTASLSLTSADVVFVSAAAGGVGVLACQLALRAGATVIGSASEPNHEFLRELGVIPVHYGPTLLEELRDAAPGGLTAALDNNGRESVDAALAAGAPPSRINTIADYAAPKDYGVGFVGGSGAGPAELKQLAVLIAAGEIILPIDSVFPLERVSEAYERLIAGHVRGKIVLALD
ncbi:NADP-dependent oxidoreductase [soil metagenome]